VKSELNKSDVDSEISAKKHLTLQLRLSRSLTHLTSEW